MPCSATCVLEVGACFSLNVATKIKLVKMRFLTALLKQKRRRATKKNGVSLIHLEKFTNPEPHIIWKWIHPFSSNQPPKLLLEVKNSEYLTFRAAFLKQKWRSATRKNYVQLKNLEFLCLVQIHIFWKLVHTVC